MYDPYALALLTKLAETILEMDIVGHLPREISRFCRYFVNYGRKLEVRVTDINYSRSPIPSGGLEIPILLIVIKANASPLFMGKMINYMKEYYTEPENIVPEIAPGDESDTSDYGPELNESSARTDSAVYLVEIDDDVSDIDNNDALGPSGLTRKRNHNNVLFSDEEDSYAIVID